MGSIQPDKGTGAQRDVGFGAWVPEIVLTAVDLPPRRSSQPEMIRGWR